MITRVLIVFYLIMMGGLSVSAQDKSLCNLKLDTLLLVDVDVRSTSDNALFFSGISRSVDITLLKTSSIEDFIKSFYEHQKYVPNRNFTLREITTLCEEPSALTNTLKNIDNSISKLNAQLKKNSVSISLKLKDGRTAFVSITKLIGFFYKTDSNNRIITSDSNGLMPSEIPYSGDVLVPYKITNFCKPSSKQQVFN